jgi:hypothetical protein
MRGGRIILLGSVFALAFDVYWLWPELPTPAVFFKHLPLLATDTLAIYAIFSLLATTALIVVDLRRVRSRLGSLSEPVRHKWVSAFAGTSLTGIALRIVEFAPDGEAGPENQRFVQSRLNAGAARQEVAALYWDWLARVQFFTTVAALLAIVGLMWAQEYAPTPLFGSSIPPQLIFAAVFAILILGFLSRTAVHAVAEPLLGTIAGFSFERLDTALLKSLAVSGEHRANGAALGSGSGAVPAPVTDLLATLLERDQQLLREAVARLGENSELLSTIAHNIAGRSAAEIGLDPHTLDQFTSAVQWLAEAVDRIDRSAGLTQPPVSPDVSLGRSSREGNLTRDLHNILKEFD